MDKLSAKEAICLQEVFISDKLFLSLDASLTVLLLLLGAIMFGDTLLPSECSLIVEELKRTSLCFQVSEALF